MPKNGAWSFNKGGAVKALLTSPWAFQADLELAVKVCDQCNRWAETKPRSGRHANEKGPHFEVVNQPSKNRARYVVAPASGFAYWLTNRYPLEFMAQLEGGRR